MARKKFTSEEIVKHIRTVEIEQGKGVSLELACKKAGVTVQTLCRWRREYGSMGLEQVKELKKLQKENSQLKKALAEMALDNSILKTVASGNF